MRLRQVPVEYKVCSNETCSTNYEGDKCPSCKTVYYEDKAIKTIKDLIILEGDTIPHYIKVWRNHCGCCGNYFDAMQCPICNYVVSNKDRKTAVWQRTFFQQIAFDEYLINRLIEEDNADNMWEEGEINE